MENNEKADTKGITSKEDLLEIGKKKFGKKIQHACPIKYPFSEENECTHRDCHAKAKERITMGSEESVFEIDCCTKHALYFRDTSSIHFPFKLSYAPSKI